METQESEAGKCKFFVGVMYDAEVPKKYVKRSREFKTYMVGSLRFKVYISMVAGITILFLLDCGLIYMLISPVDYVFIKLLYSCLLIIYNYEMYVMIKYASPKCLKRSYKCITRTISKTERPVLVKHDCLMVQNNLFNYTCRMAWILILFSFTPNDKINGPQLFYNLKYRPYSVVYLLSFVGIESLVPIIYYLVFKVGKNTVVQFPSSFKVYRITLNQIENFTNKYVVVNCTHYLLFSGIVATITSLMTLYSYEFLYPNHISSTYGIISALMIIIVTCATLTSIVIKKFYRKIALIMSSYPYVFSVLYFVFMSLYGFCLVGLILLPISPPGK